LRLIWSPQAVDALSQAVRYIAMENPGAATRWAEGLLEALNRLERFPRSGRIVPELGREEYRELLYGDFRVIRRVGSNAVFILTVVHGRRTLDANELVDSP
jgi:plasmid stabilization system protein ParE